MGIVVRGTMVTLTLSKVRVHNHLLIYAYLFVVTSHILSWGPTCSQDLRAGTMGSEQARWDLEWQEQQICISSPLPTLGSSFPHGRSIFG